MARESLPSLQRPPWYSRKITGVLASNLVPAGLMCGVAVISNSSEAAKVLAWCASGWLLLAVLLQALQALRADRDAKGTESLLDVAGCLQTMHAALLAWKQSQSVDSITSECRITVHREVENRALEQLVDYVGGTGGPQGRRVSARGGLVGRVMTSGKPLAMHRSDANLTNYHAELCEHWHMTETEAATVRPDRMSFMAVPIKGTGGMAIGAVYLDSAVIDFFDDKTQVFVIQTCEGLVNYFKLRSGSK
jgi:hypothetical protein